MPVGQFPGAHDFRKRTVRQPDNPMDTCTIVSIFPIEIDERKHTIQPGRFIIPPGTYDKPSLLHVKPSSWWKELEDDQPLLEIPVSSLQVANSVIVDYCNGILCCNMNDIMPGLFFIPGTVSIKDVRDKHSGLLDKYRTCQSRWFGELVKMADALWSRSSGNPLAISDIMRLAARELNQNSKEWLQDFQAVETVRCIACGHMRNPMFPVCPNCKTVVDRDRFAKSGLMELPANDIPQVVAK